MKRKMLVTYICFVLCAGAFLTMVPQKVAASDEYFIYSKFNPDGIGDVTGVGGYIEYYGIPEWGDEIQYIYFLSGSRGYKFKVWVTDGDGDGVIEPRQHPDHYLPEFQGPIEPRHFQIVSSKDISGYTGGSSYHTEEFYVSSSGVFLGAYPYGIHKWDHDWNFIEKIANSPPTRTESLAYNAADNIWYAGGRYRTIYQLSDTDSDGSFLDESWVAIFTYPSYGGSHHDGMEYVGGYLWISDMTSDVIGKWQYNTATSSWEELDRFTYTEPGSVEGMGFGPNDHFWCGSGWGSSSYIYELGNEITRGYPIADAGPDVDAYPPIIPVRFYAGGSHHTDPSKEIVLYEWDFENDGTWDYSFGRFVYPTGLLPTAPNGKRSYGYDGACTYYNYAGWLARWDKGNYPEEDKYHIGQDIEADEGDPVYAIADGNIIYVSVDEGWGEGNFGIFVRHNDEAGNAFLALYGHVIPNSEDLEYDTSGAVEPPIAVVAGEAFAIIGPLVTTHLHFGIHPGYDVPDSPFGRMPLSSWPDPNAHPGDPNGPDTNGFVDPLDWIDSQKPYDPVPLVVEHAYPAYYNPDGSIDWDKTSKDYTASLRVTDDSGPPLQNTDTCIVHITNPPWKPVADPGGPYEDFKNSPVQLDGLESYDPESRMFPPEHPWYETIAEYEWDLDNDGDFDDSDDGQPTWTWDSEGIYTIGLRVTDSQPNGPGGTYGPMDMDTKYTTVVISEAQIRVTVTIVEVRAIDSMDPMGDDADFYARVSIDGQSLPDTSVYSEDNNDIYPEWTFSRLVSKEKVPIHIEIWDSDLVFDDQVDIDHDSGDSDLDLVFDVSSQSISGDVIYGYSRGEGDSNRAEIWFNIGLDTGDKDGDGLFDSWETNGIHMDDDGNVDLDLPSLGADPEHKDLFIEIDWMQDQTHSHRPSDWTVNTVRQAFEDAPVTNPDGNTGITLHIDRSNDVPHQPVPFGSWTAAGYDWNDFDQMKLNNFNANRRFVYNYVIFIDSMPFNPLLGYAPSGIAELPGNDFIVALGNFPEDVSEAGTLMHEFGHNLGLRHGGGEDFPNHKPNYLSIMNYRFQLIGIPPYSRIDYSGIALPSLDENDLNEQLGIQDGADNTIYAISPGITAVGFGIGPIDWDGDNIIETNVQADINGNGQNNDILTGYNDWANILLNVRGLTEDFADGVHNFYSIEPDLETLESLRPTQVIQKFAEGPVAVPLHTIEWWNITYLVTNINDYEISDVIVKDNFGANLNVTLISSTKGDYYQYTNKPGNQYRFKWEIGNMAPLETVSLKLNISTGLNPAGKQEFTEPGLKVLNSGATVKWKDNNGKKDSAETGQIFIWANVSVSDTMGAIAGYVTDATTGEPLSDYIIELKDLSENLLATFITGEKGFYCFSSLTPADYIVLCSGQSYTATVSAEKVTRIDFELIV